MRYLIIILSLLSFSFSQLLPSDYELLNMTFTEKTLLYNSEKKSPTGTILREMLIPSLGYAYIDDWKRGLYFFGGQAISLYIVLEYDKKIFKDEYTGMYEYWIGEPCSDIYNSDPWTNSDEKEACEDRFNADMERFNKIRDIALLSYSAISIYKLIDAFKKTKDYNKQLHNKIFQKDNKLSFLILPTSNGAYLNFNYNF